MFGKLAGYKTYVTAAVAIFTAWCAVLTGDLAVKEAVTASFGALLAAGIRHGISTAAGKPVELKAREGLKQPPTLLLFILLGALALTLSACTAPGSNGNAKTLPPAHLSYDPDGDGKNPIELDTTGLTPLQAGIQAAMKTGWWWLGQQTGSRLKVTAAK
jgi:hypothetical protein